MCLVSVAPIHCIVAVSYPPNFSINYVPKDPSLNFYGALCEPGDFHGQNVNTEAKVFCK